MDIVVRDLPFSRHNEHLHQVAPHRIVHNEPVDTITGTVVHDLSSSLVALDRDSCL